MKINQLKLIEAYKTTEAFADNDKFSTETLWDIFNLRQILKPHIEFQIKREDAIRNKYSEFADENGGLTGEKADAYIKEMNDLNNLEKDIKWKKIDVKLQEGITIRQMESLADFINFTK